MTGAELLEAFASQARARRGVTGLPDAELARELGISIAMLRVPVAQHEKIGQRSKAGSWTYRLSPVLTK